MDVGEYFVKSTYTLEGDGPLALVCYEKILKVRAVIQTAHYPNVNATAVNTAPGNPIVQQQLVTHALSCVQSGLDYFNEKFGDDTKSPLNAFKAARYFSPSKLNEIQPSASDIDQTTIENLKKELPIYLAKAADVALSMNGRSKMSMNYRVGHLLNEFFLC